MKSILALAVVLAVSALSAPVSVLDVGLPQVVAEITKTATNGELGLSPVVECPM